jgi:hypothetical protein
LQADVGQLLIAKVTIASNHLIILTFSFKESTLLILRGTVGKVVVFKKPQIIRCNSCNKIKPDVQEKFSHRGIDNTGSTPKSWVVYQSGWKRVEQLPLKNGKPEGGSVEKVFFHCPDCRSL